MAVEVAGGVRYLHGCVGGRLAARSRGSNPLQTGETGDAICALGFKGGC